MSDNLFYNMQASSLTSNQSQKSQKTSFSCQSFIMCQKKTLTLNPLQYICTSNANIHFIPDKKYPFSGLAFQAHSDIHAVTHAYLILPHE